MTSFRDELRDLINKHSLENGSNTPDFILAQHLVDSLAAFDASVQRREEWCGRGKASAEIERLRTDLGGAPRSR